jgi:hypothetical protein
LIGGRVSYVVVNPVIASPIYPFAAMGICSSCLGLNRDRDLSSEVSFLPKALESFANVPFHQDENSRLLFDDPHANHYGSFGEQGAGTIQTDPQEFQRETEALQKVVAQTSKYAHSAEGRLSNKSPTVPAVYLTLELTFLCSHLVDIFAMVPQTVPPAPNTVFPAHDARLLRYQDVLAKMSTDDPSKVLLLSTESTPNISDGWISEEEGLEEPKGYKAVRSENVGALLGGFADAETWNEDGI